jgi:hypothetical protein
LKTKGDKMDAGQKGIPIFIKIEDYKDVLDIINLIKHKIKEAQSNLEKITEIKKQEDNEIELWSHTLEEIEKKIDYIDRSLFDQN